MPARSARGQSRGLWPVVPRTRQERDEWLSKLAAVGDAAPAAEKRAASARTSRDRQTAHTSASHGPPCWLGLAEHGGAAAAAAEAAEASGRDRRGNKTAAQAVREARRCFAKAEEKAWDQKYKFHSSKHMRNSFPRYVESRLDPFNKDSSWGQTILEDVAAHCAHGGVDPEELLQISGGRAGTSLAHAEVKKALSSVIPKAGDLEVAAVLGSIASGSGSQVDATEFCSVLRQCMRKGVAPPQGASGGPAPSFRQRSYRHPVGGVKRFPPAAPEGGESAEAAGADPGAEDAAKWEAMDRVRQLLAEQPPAARTSPCKYQYFGGGGAHSLAKKGPGASAGASAAKEVPDYFLGDPQKPGFLCDFQAQKTSGWLSARTPRRRMAR